MCRYFNVEKLVDWGIKLLNSPLDTLIELLPTIDPSIVEQKLLDKLGWLADYTSLLARWNQMVKITRLVETQLKLCGINQQSLTTLAIKPCLSADSKLENFQQHIQDYVAIESSQIPPGATFLATSDVIESLFGKYKQFSSRSPFKQLSQMLLTISLSTMNLTKTVVKQALETIRFVDVEVWSDQVFGQSMLSKRKTLFTAKFEDTETA